MQKKAFLSILLAGLLCFSGITALAAADDATDAVYYTPIQAFTDFEDKTPAELPTTSGDNDTNFRQIFRQEENGNIYWYAGRYLDKTIDKNWNAGFYTTNTAMGTTGEYIIQTKLKFSQKAAGGMMHLGFRVGHGGDKSKQLYFGISNINTLDDTPESIFFKVEWYENNKHYNQQFSNLASCVLKPEVWYLVRNVYNLDNKTARLEFYNADGTECLATTGDFELPETVSAATDQNNSGGSASTYTIPYNLSFSAIRSDTNLSKGSGLGIDDFIIAKAENKPVSVTCGQGGTVQYGGETVSSGAVVPVAYNSPDKETFTITPDQGYAVQDIKVNGQSLGNTVTSVDFTSVTAAQTLEVTFEQLPQAPSLSESAPTYTYTDANNGTQTAYFSVNPGYGYTFTDGIAKIYEVGNAASEAAPLKLESSSVISNSSWDGKFGVRIYGDGMKTGNQYVLAPYFVAQKDGVEVTIDPIEEDKAGQYTFTFGE
ncbi:MAG: hypothetical protein SO147_01360 [Clostridia bacterium]|nr:hypothetical protein [Clostridia bacterium]